ncbi:translocation/assembly module TamB domain-containing protein [Cytophagaceae bacterium ABcell3]|nr:translocation/assembly module TamB domain-containing protein [Cytophagaceae bacterium ABcell3]
MFIILAMITLLLGVYIAIRIPQVQQYALGHINSFLQKELETNINIGEMKLDPLRQLVLQNVYIEDQAGDTLFYSRRLRVDFDILPLLDKKVNLEIAELNGAVTNIYRHQEEEGFNYQFIVDYFASDEPAEPSDWVFQAEALLLKNLKLDYLDQPSGVEVNGHTQRVLVNIDDLGLENNHLVVSYAALHRFDVTLNQLEGERSPKTTQVPDTSGTDDFFITIDVIDLTQSAFAYNDFNEDPVAEGMDFNRLSVMDISGAFKNIALHGDSIKGELKKLSLQEKSGFVLNDLSLLLTMDAPGLDVKVTQLSTPHSHLDSLVHVQIPELSTIGEQISELKTYADFGQTTISLKDIWYFAPDLEIPDELQGTDIQLTGRLRGNVGDLTFNDFSIGLDQARLAGNLKVSGLPEYETAHIDLHVKEGLVRQKFLGGFLPPDEELPVNIRALGTITTSGRIAGQLHDVSAKLQTHTALGFIGTDIKAKTDKDFNLKSHSGTVQVKRFQTGRLLQTEEVGTVTASLAFIGFGNDIRSFDAEVKSAFFNNYTYQNVKAAGSFVNQQLTADIVTADPNLQTDFSAKVDMRSPQMHYVINGDFQHVNLHELKLSEDTFCLSAGIYADLKGTDIDDIVGEAHVKNFRVENPKLQYTLESVVVLSELNNGRRNLTLASPILDASLRGDFSYSDIPAAAAYFVSSYTSAISAPEAKVHSLNFDISVRNISDLLEVFAPDVEQFDTLHVAGTLRGDAHALTMKAFVGEFVYNGQQVNKLLLDVDGGRDSLHFHVRSDVYNTGSFAISDPSVNGSLFNDSLFVNVKANHQGEDNSIDIDALLTHRLDTFKATMPRAIITLGGNNWKLEPNNTILYAEEYLAINDLVMSHADQKLAINTRRKKNMSDLVSVQMEKIKIEGLAELLDIQEYDLRGQINGDVSIINPLAGLGANANLTMDSVFVGSEPVGTITLHADKLENKGRVDTDLTVKGHGNDARVSGYLDGGTAPASIDFAVSIREFAIARLQPFLKDIFFAMEGNMEANLKIKGTVDHPGITGNVLFKDRNMLGLTMTQTNYKVTDQEIIFNKESIEFKDFTLKDMRDRSALVNGLIRHKNFEDIFMDVKFTADQFELIDSPRRSDALFFGKLIATVKMGVKGPIDDMDIDLGLTTEKGTDLHLQLLADQNVIRPQYIVFKGETDAEGVQRSLLPGSDQREDRQAPALDIARYNFRSRITLTPEASFTIVVDPANGDKVTARGEGDLQLSMDEDQNINLFGSMAIKEGIYSMSFLNVINREFRVRSGSTISWAGDPEDPNLNITALYETRAARIDLVPDMIDMMSPEEVRAARRNLPVRVAMTMTGDLSEPRIGFDIEIPEATAAADAAVVNQRVEQIRNDETELNKQVFGLVVLNRFIYDGAGSTDTGEESVLLGQAGQSVSRILNKQLENLSDQFLGGVELEVNVQSLDQREGPFAQNIELQASRQISQRVTVTAGGTVNVGTPERSGQFAGDYAVLYRINESGNVNIRFFRTSQHNLYTDNLNTRTGVSINHHKDFDSIRDLWPW